MWKITDKITDITQYEFENEWNGIYGFFEIIVNNQSLGYCPDIINDIEGNEDILYWINQLYNARKELKNYKQYSFDLLSMNLVTLYLRRECNTIIISSEMHEKKEILWEENITYSEFHETIENTVNLFKREIEKKNSFLLHARLLDFPCI